MPESAPARPRDRRRCGSRCRGRRPPSPPHTGLGRSGGGVRGWTGRTSPSAVSGSAARCRRPWSSTASGGCRCVRSLGPRCVCSGRRRSRPRLRTRPTPAARCGPTRGSCQRHRRCGTRPATPTGQTGTRPSVDLLQCVTWSFHTEDPADGRLHHAAPPLSLKPHHHRGLSLKGVASDRQGVVVMTFSDPSLGGGEATDLCSNRDDRATDG